MTAVMLGVEVQVEVEALFTLMAPYLSCWGLKFKLKLLFTLMAPYLVTCNLNQMRRRRKSRRCKADLRGCLRVAAALEEGHSRARDSIVASMANNLIIGSAPPCPQYRKG
eukprot:scaffold11789_cov38-Cyclotella_meneghiniana.AAC.2